MMLHILQATEVSEGSSSPEDVEADEESAEDASEDESCMSQALQTCRIRKPSAPLSHLSTHEVTV